VNWAWWLIGAIAVAAVAWHEVTEHHAVARLFRRPVDPSPHHHMWAGIGQPQRRAIHAEMAVSAVLLAAVTGLWPVIGLSLAALLTVTACAWSLFHAPGRSTGRDQESEDLALTAMLLRMRGK
jgi:hypothetical protein